MFRYAPFIFFIYLLCEILTTSYFYTHFSPFLVTVFIIFMMFAGILLLKMFRTFLATSTESYFIHKINFNNIFQQNLLYLWSAILFIIPGILSDFIGIMLILFVLYLQLTGKISQNKNIFEGEEDVIDAEIIDNGDRAIIDNIDDRL